MSLKSDLVDRDNHDRLTPILATPRCRPRRLCGRATRRVRNDSTSHGVSRGLNTTPISFLCGATRSRHAMPTLGFGHAPDTFGPVTKDSWQLFEILPSRSRRPSIIADRNHGGQGAFRGRAARGPAGAQSVRSKPLRVAGPRIIGSCQKRGKIDRI